MHGTNVFRTWPKGARAACVHLLELFLHHRIATTSIYGMEAPARLRGAGHLARTPPCGAAARAITGLHAAFYCVLMFTHMLTPIIVYDHAYSICICIYVYGLEPHTHRAYRE